MASRSLGSLTLDLIARVGGFTSGLSHAEREAQRRTRGIQNTFRGMGRVIAGTFAAIGGAALVRSIVRATSEAEAAFAQLRNAVEQNGGAVGRTTDQLANMASELQKVSTFGDETIMTAQGLLLRFQSIQGINFDRATQSTLDLATALGMDLPAAARLVGKALESPQKGLTQLERSGVALEKSQADLVKRLVATGRQAEAQQILLGALEQRFGGAARAARDTFGGALKSVQNAFGDLLEAKGGGLTDATNALNEFTELLQDPATVSAANTLASAIVTAFTSAAKAITGTVNVTKFLAEELASIRFGAAADDVVRLQDELEKLQEIRDSTFSDIFTWTGGQFSNRLRFFGKDGLVKWYSDEDLDREIKRLKTTIAEATSTIPPVISTSTGTVGGGPSLPPPPSEEFLKLEARLKQQIALFGQVGEAAKIAYQIQSDQLDDLSSTEQQRIIRLARQYDLLVDNAAAEKELEHARKQLQSTYDSQVSTLERQIALTGEVTELERVRFDISRGALQGIDSAQSQYLETLAKQIDMERQSSEIQSRIKDLVEENLTPQERYNQTIENLNRLRDESIELLGEEGLAYETYARAVERAQKELEEATKTTNEFFLEAARNTQNILADTLFGAMQGEMDDIGEMFKKMIDRMVANALAAQLATKLFGDPENRGGGGGWFGAASSWFGSFFGGNRASGGSVSSGMLYRVNENGVEGLSIPGQGDYLMMGGRSGNVVPNDRIGRGSTVNQVINVQGRVDTRTAQQLQIEAARRQRISSARLG